LVLSDGSTLIPHKKTDIARVNKAQAAIKKIANLSYASRCFKAIANARAPVG
jgi:hypothetical protein